MYDRKDPHSMDILDFPAPHIPSKLPLDDLDEAISLDRKFLRNLITKERKLSEFIGYLQNLPTPDILITSLTLQEAVLSSKIEGTIATIDDVVNNTPDTETLRNDIVEIENYCNAIDYGKDMLANTDRGISKNLIKTLHIILMKNNVRGAGKTPGEFKIEQNYIKNTHLGNFTPLPPVLTDEYIDNLVEYISADDEISDLIQAAIMHAQFEMIHPFKDGNGRVGRLLIPLLLFHKGVLPSPIFYISRYFAENNDDYKERLSNISRNENTKDLIQAWKNWLAFFFEGVAIESRRHIATSKQIIELHKEMTTAVNKTDMIPLVDMLFKNLKVQPKDAIEQLKLPGTSVRTELKRLEEKGYIEKHGSQRKTFYVFRKLLKIVQS